LPVVLLASEQTVAQAEDLKSAIQEMGGRDCRVVQTDPYDVSEIGESIAAAASRMKAPVVNLTGGTKMMSLAAFMEAQARGWSWEYVVTERGVIITRDGQHPLEERHFKPLTPDVYLKVAGLMLHPRKPLPTRYSELTPELLEGVRLLRDQPRLRNWLKQYGGDEHRKLPRGYPDAILRQRQALTQMVIDNSWLELAAADAAKHAGGTNIAVNMHITPRAAGGQVVENEIDVVFTYGGRLVVLECKTGGTWRGQLVRERQAIGHDLGGKYAVTGFVVETRNQANGAKAIRAREAGMFVGVASPDLAAELKEFLDRAGPAL